MTISLPTRPSLDSLRKQAKKLAREVAASDAAAHSACARAIAARRPTACRSATRNS